MKAAVRRKYGNPGTIKIEEIDKPVPGDDEVLIRVFATTVNRTDCANLIDRPSPQFDKGNLNPELFKGRPHLRLAEIFIEKHGIKTVDSTIGRRKFFAYDLDPN